MSTTKTAYPKGAKVNKNGQVFLHGKYLGFVDHVLNWGTDFLARPEWVTGRNKFFKTKREAALYILEVAA
jgi:hypothetical protein